MLLDRARLLIATAWVGSLWAIGYIVAPTLFATLSDRVLAGTIAGSLFRVEAWVSIGCGILLFLLIMSAKNAMPRARNVPLGLILAMLACTLISYFGLQPAMALLREAAGPTGVMESSARTEFGILHGISSGLYLIQSLLGAALILKIR